MEPTRSKQIEIPPLAQRKMRRRGVSATLVEETLRVPEQVVEEHDGRLVAQKHMTIHGKDGLLRVVYEETATAFVVVTAYFTTDIPRYWRNPS